MKVLDTITETIAKVLPDQEAGALLGARIGDYIYNHKLRPEHDGDYDDR